MGFLVLAGVGVGATLQTSEWLVLVLFAFLVFGLLAGLAGFFVLAIWRALWV